MNDPQTLTEMYDLAWRHLTRGVADRRAPARHPTVATVAPNGRPEARTMVLRQADRSAAVLEVHTDSATPKVTALKASPWVAMHVWVPKASLQIRAVAKVDILTGPEVAAQWARVPEGSRVSYGTTPVPGAPIDTALDYEKSGDPARFAVLRCAVDTFDLLHLGTEHRRASFSRDTNWAGTWVAP